MLARHGEPAFSSEERNLARGMARVLALTVRLLRVVDAERGLRALSDRQRAENERLLESLEERQRLLERLSKIQRSIVSRRDLQEVLDAIVTGAGDLLGDETVGLRLLDPEDPEPAAAGSRRPASTPSWSTRCTGPRSAGAPAVARRPRAG